MPNYFNLPLVIEPEQLKPLLSEKKLLVVDVGNEQRYHQAHIPGAVHLPPSALISGKQPAPGKVPPLTQLLAALAQLGVEKDTHIIAYDDEGGGWAGRLIWTLDILGLSSYSYLNGGLHAWYHEGHGLAAGPTNTTPAEPLDIDEINLQPLATKEYILEHLNSSEHIIWDARSPEEYNGTRAFASKSGHIPGAINFEWTEGMDPERHLRIHNSLEEKLERIGITPDKEIITHCQSHHRSGFTYLAAKSLGFKKIKAYDGSWSEWGNSPETPVE